MKKPHIRTVIYNTHVINNMFITEIKLICINLEQQFKRQRNVLTECPVYAQSRQRLNESNKNNATAD